MKKSATILWWTIPILGKSKKSRSGGSTSRNVDENWIEGENWNVDENWNLDWGMLVKIGMHVKEYKWKF